MSGIAVRNAATLGLNLQNENKKVISSAKEARYRVWWALCSTETMLATMTGRPTLVLETDCSTPLPLPIDEDEPSKDNSGPATTSSATKGFRRHSGQESKTSHRSSATPGSSFKVSDAPATEVPSGLHRDPSGSVPPSDALFFLYHTNLSILTNAVLNQLYRASAVKRTWAEMQDEITKFDARIERWRRSLPPVFDFTKKQREQQFGRHRISLGFFYYSTKTIINRPCLCRIDRRIPHESDKAKESNRVAAARCVYAAKGVVMTLPNEPNAVGLNRVSPWWCLVHYLVQASTVLMLELSFWADHMPTEADEILEAAKKSVYWLRSMAEDNVAAYRAWRLCDDLLRKLAPKIGRDANDLPEDVPAHGAWSGYTATSQDAYTSDFPTAVASQEYNDEQHDNLEFPSQIYSTYDQFFTNDSTAAPLSPRQFSSMVSPTIQWDAMISGHGDIEHEEQWNVDGPTL